MWGPKTDTMKGRKVNKIDRSLPIKDFQARGKKKEGRKERKRDGKKRLAQT